MTLASRTPFWIATASLAGFLAAVLPIYLAVAVLAGAVLAVSFYLEPSLALLAALCTGPLKVLLQTETMLPLDVGQLFLAVFIGFWGLRFAIDGERFFIPLQPMGWVLIFFFGASLSLWTAYSDGAAVRELLKWGQILLLIMLVANLRQAEWLIFGVVLSAALQASIGIWEFLGGSGAAHLWILDFRFFRAFGTFGQPNPFGAFMGLVLPLGIGTAAGYLWQSSRRWHLNIFLVGAVFTGLSGIIFLGLLASWSRGAWLGFIAAAAVMIWSFPRQQWMGIGTVLVGGLGVLLLWGVGLLPQGIMDRLLGFTEDFAGIGDVRGVVINDANYAVIERLAHWQSALDMAREHPWLGVGFGNYEVAYPSFALINWNDPLGHAHNYYLNLWAETGIIGLLSYLIMWLGIFTITWKQLSSSEWHQRGILVGLLGAWTHIAVHSVLDKLYVNNLFLHVGVMLGILAVWYKLKRNA